MALYRNMGNALQRGQSQIESARATWGQRTKENQTTEYEPASPSGAQMAGQAMGLMSLPGQLENAYSNIKDGANWLATKIGGAPDTRDAVVKAGTGAVDLTGGAQMNSGAQIGAEELQNAFYKTPAQETEQLASEAAAQAVNPASVADGTQTATQAATQASQGGLSTMGATLAPAAGGVGGLAGKELGRAIGGDTGATIGGLAGSMGGAHLGGMAAGSLAGGAAGGAAAGATAGSVVPGMGTVIGAGIGALTSFFL